jgi:hypothetical protein
VLTVDNLAGSPDRNGLGGLPIENPYVLRSGGCLGYLKNFDATADGYRRRLREARNELEAMTTEIEFGEDPDEDAISDLAREAHGLAGTVTRIYDMLGVDVHRVIDLPDWTLNDADRRAHVATMIGKQTSIASRYGVYSAERVLYEPRSEKREQLLGTPDVSTADPTGSVCGSWVLVGDRVTDLREQLDGIDESLVLQEDGEHYAPFRLDLDIVDGNRRSAYATALARQCSLKDIETTRQTVSILQALTSDVFAATYGLQRGLASEQENQGRNLDLNEIRAVLSVLDPEEILPELGPASVSEAVQVLADVDKPVSSSQLVELMAGTESTQTLRNNAEWFDKLEAAGLLDRTDHGPGKATTWRLRLPFDEERRQSSAPTPRFVAGATDGTGFEMRPTDAIAELFFTLADDLDREPVDFASDYFFIATTGLSDQQDLGPLLRRHPDHRPVVELVIELLDAELDEFIQEDQRRAPIPTFGGSVTLGQDPDPETSQASVLASP